jgi:hypothetical protein
VSVGPVPTSGTPIESILAWHTIKRAAILGPLLIAAIWLWRGSEGALAAAIGLAVVIINFWLSGRIMSLAARMSLGMYHAAALLGFALRLGLITVTMLIVARLYPIDRIAFGISAVVAYLILIGFEAVALSKGKERELEWSK